MTAKKTLPKVSRRGFMTSAAVASATIAAPSGASAVVPTAAARTPAVARPTAHQVALEANVVTEVKPVAGRPGSDFMVDVIRSLDIDYVYTNPASSFRGLHESLINYGRNTKPEMITCMHEESAVAMAHGYFKASGKPQMVLCHGTVGLMHATMAIYNAWVDRVPVIVVGGNDLDAARRAPGTPTNHSAQDVNALVRDMTKWDDSPVSLQHFAQSFVRAYKISMTPPCEPVMIALDGGLQEEPMRDHGGGLYIPRYVRASPPHADTAALREAAKVLANAEHPVIILDRTARTQNGVDLLVQLAELVQAPVVDQSNRMNFPNTHHLCQSAGAQQLIRNADVIVGLEVSDFWNTVNLFIDNGVEDGFGTRSSRIKPGTKLITISSAELNQKSNYQDFQRFQSVDIAMVGDAEASLPYFIEAVRSSIGQDRKSHYEKRGAAMRKAWQELNERTKQAAAIGWDANPISVPRLCAELWSQIKGLDYSLVASRPGIGSWPNRLWTMDKHHQWLGGSGGGGIGYGLPASIGAAHANNKLGRFSVALQGDGDMMFAPGALWTAARHKIPLLSVLHNNKGYHQEVMHVQRMSNRRNRVANRGSTIADLGPVGTRIENPDIKYAPLAESMGWWATPPISDPSELAPQLKKAIEVVKSGQPALVDVVSQPR